MNELERKLKEINDNLEYLRNHSQLSSSAKEEKIREYEQERQEINNFINFFTNTNERIEVLQSQNSLSKEEKKELKSLRESIDSKRKEYNKKYQGRYRDMLSASIGEIDKRIHNAIYRNNTNWRSKNKRVRRRYENTLKYFLKNTGISFGILLVPGFVSMFVPSIAPYVVGAASLYFGQTIFKTIAAYHNKRVYGGPRLVRKYDISQNGYFNNNENCWNKIINNNLLSNSDVMNINKDKINKNLDNNQINEKKSSQIDGDFLTLVSSVISKSNINELSDSKITQIVRMVEDNNLQDKLSEDIKNKYLLIKNKFNNKDKSNDILLNSINKELENLAIASVNNEKKEYYIKVVNDNNLYDKLSDIAKEKYNLLLASDKKTEDNQDKKIEYINSLITNFKYKTSSFDDYDNLFKYISDNDLEKRITGNIKIKLENLRLIYNAMINIRDFDMNNFDSNKAIIVVDAVKNNKLTNKLNSAMYSKYQLIQKKLSMLFDDKKDDSNNKEKLINIKNMLLKIDLSNLSLNDLSSLIEYIEKNGLSKELSDILEKLYKIYNIKSKNKPKMEDYGNKRIGIMGDNQESLAKYFINHPPKITKDMSYDMKNIATLAKKIKDGIATTSEVNRYAILIYNLTGQDWFQEEMEYYLGSEYERFQKDNEKYEGKRAK